MSRSMKKNPPGIKRARSPTSINRAIRPLHPLHPHPELLAGLVEAGDVAGAVYAGAAYAPAHGVNAVGLA